jgi:hypothetical protein
MEIKLLKAYKNRHGKSFPIGKIIDFGNDKAKELIASGIGEEYDIVKEMKAKYQTDDLELVEVSDVVKVKAIRGFKYKGKSYESDDILHFTESQAAVYAKLKKELKVIILD